MTKNDLRPITVFLNDGTCETGYFHKFTQGNMAGDALIMEDEKGNVKILNFGGDFTEMKFMDVKPNETVTKACISHFTVV